MGEAKRRAEAGTAPKDVTADFTAKFNARRPAKGAPPPREAMQALAAGFDMVFFECKHSLAASEDPRADIAILDGQMLMRLCPKCILTLVLDIAEAGAGLGLLDRMPRMLREIAVEVSAAKRATAPAPKESRLGNLFIRRRRGRG